MWEYNNLEELYHHGVLGMRWGHRKARLQAYNKALVKSRKDKANAKVQAIKNKKLDVDALHIKNEKIRALSIKEKNNKLNKARVKADKINRSKYGQTRGEILAKGALRHLGALTIGVTGMKVAQKMGNQKAADAVAAVTSGYTTYNTFKTGYKLLTNYNKPTKKSGTRLSYK